MTLLPTSSSESNGSSASTHSNPMTSSSPSSSSSSSSSESNPSKRLPTCLILIGMAGSGKTTTMQRLKSYLLSEKKSPYVINLDPAVTYLPYAPNIDIRDTVNYKEVMNQYDLGPNGAILTSLNLFTTKFDQVIQLLYSRKETTDYFLIDTPGQIEVFTWSASGTIITDTLSSIFPTVLVYIMDTPRSCSPATFMSNMLYACSILYRTRLPFVIVFNKTDVVDGQLLLTWMHDFDSFQSSLTSLNTCNSLNDRPSFMNGFIQSMALVLDEFYSFLQPVLFSAATGQGCSDVFQVCEVARKQYFEEYVPEVERRKQSRDQLREVKKVADLEKLVKELKMTSSLEKKEIEEKSN